jgi:hypothetical protein
VKVLTEMIADLEKGAPVEAGPDTNAAAAPPPKRKPSRSAKKTTRSSGRRRTRAA